MHLVCYFPLQMGCSTTVSSTSPWFDACRKGDIDLIKKLKDDYHKKVDERPFRIIQSQNIEQNEKNQQIQQQKPEIQQQNIQNNDNDDNDDEEDEQLDKQPDLILPRFTGLMYAVLYEHTDIIKILLEDELFIELDQNVFIPTVRRLPFMYAIVDDAKIQQEFKNNKINNYVFVPANSTVLDLAIMIGNLTALEQIMEFAQTLPTEKLDFLMKHVNSHHQSNLMLLTQLQSDEAFDFLEKYGEIIIRTQFMYENIMIENCLFTAFQFANVRYLTYFMSMAHIEKYNKFLTERFKRSKFTKTIMPALRERIDESQRHYDCFLLHQNFTQNKYPPIQVWAFNRYLSNDPNARQQVDSKTIASDKMPDSSSQKQKDIVVRDNATNDFLKQKNQSNANQENTVQKDIISSLLIQKPTTSTHSKGDSLHKQIGTLDSNLSGMFFKIKKEEEQQQKVKPQISAVQLVQQTVTQQASVQNLQIQQSARGSIYAQLKQSKYNLPQEIAQPDLFNKILQGKINAGQSQSVEQLAPLLLNKKVDVMQLDIETGRKK